MSNMYEEIYGKRGEGPNTQGISYSILSKLLTRGLQHKWKA